MIEHPGIAPAGEPTSFEGCLQRVNPSKTALDNLASRPDTTPIIMLNMLRFRPRGDNSIYNLYGREAAPEVEKVGSFIGFFGATIDDLDPNLGFDPSWDGVVLPVYQRRRSFLELQRSEPYQLAIPYRSAGTSRRTLYVLSDDKPLLPATTSVKTMFESGAGLAVEDEDVYSIELLKLDGKEDQDWARADRNRDASSEVVLSLRAEVPIVSERLWDHCLVTRFKSRESLEEFYLDVPAGSLRIACYSVPLPA